YAVGKIPGGFIKREGRPSEKAILSSRLIDRPIRPLFPEGYRNEVQVISTVLSVDQNCSSEIAAMIGSSIALCISDIPFLEPIAGVHVGRVNGEFIINPTTEQQEQSDLDLTVAGTKDAINMVEAGANEVDEEVMLDAILFGHEEIKRLVEFQEEIIAAHGVEKAEVILFDEDAQLTEKIEAEEDVIKRVKMTLDRLVKEEVRRLITVDKVRPDGRGLDEISPLSSRISLLPRAHGSGLFTRGQTQALSVCTLGALGDVQIL